jgi:hypothetical protein
MKRRLLILAGVSAAMMLAVLFLVHSLEHNVVTKADSISPGMSTNQVRQIMGDPKSISATPHYEEWHYDAPAQWEFDLSLRPFRFSVWQRDWITIIFTLEGKVVSVWIHSPCR